MQDIKLPRRCGRNFVAVVKDGVNHGNTPGWRDPLSRRIPTPPSPAR